MDNDKGVGMIVVIIVAVVVIGIAAILLLNRSANISDTDLYPQHSDQSDITTEEATDTLVGFSLSPQSYTETAFTQFMGNVIAGGNTLTAAGDVSLLSNEESGSHVVMSLSQSYGYTPVILVSEPVVEHIVPFVEEFKPPYLGIGVEVNRKYKDSIESFADNFSSVYDEVKSVSPETVVFVTFQLENMKGLDGGLFGNENNPANNQWEMLELFPKSDLVGFTTYPGLIYKDPNDIPADYYASIADYTDKPIVFVEIGWSSRTPAPGWESTQSEQVRFIETFFNATESLDVQMYIWPFLYDQTGDNLPVPFESMGLFDLQGNEKLGWNAWRNEADNR